MKTGPQTVSVQGNVINKIPDTDEALTAKKAIRESLVADIERETSRPAGATLHPSYFVIKRGIDIVGSLAGLLFLFPVFLTIAILIRLDSRGSILHRRRVLALQKHRADREPETFDAFKFRTMVEGADTVLRTDPNLLAEYQKEYKLVNDPRVTRLGAKLRPLSLDELPQLINVLRGQMSLVGPRMITPPELAMYGPNKARLLSVKPGLTGLWQVSGRTNIPYSERVRLDMFYIENRSVLLDLQILWRTVGCVLARKGAV